MDRNEIIRNLDNYKDTYVEEYNAYKLKSGTSLKAINAGIGLDIIRNYYGLLYFNEKGDWSKPKWRPNFSERLFFLRHRILGKILGKSHVFTEIDQKRLWTIRGGENYAFESDTTESREYARRFFTELFKKIPIAKDASIIELGCGSGRNLALLKEMGFTNLRGVDFSPTQVAYCVKSGFDAVEMNIAKLRFSEASFDLVYTNSVLLHVPPDAITNVLKEAVRISKGLVAFREKTYEVEDSEGHVNRYNYVRRLREIGCEGEIVGEFVVVKK